MPQKPTYQELQQRIEFLENELAQMTPLGEDPALYESILNGIINGVWVTDENDVIYYTNAAMQAIAGISKDQILGANVLKEFPESTLEHFAPYYTKAKETLKPVHYDAVPVVTPAGRQSYQSGWLIPRLKRGVFVGMICSVEEMTEKKLAQEALKAAQKELEERVEQRTAELVHLNTALKREIEGHKETARKLEESRKELERTLDATTEGIWTWNFLTDELFFSPRYYSMLGYEPQEFPSDYKNWVNLIHPDDKENAVQIATEFLKWKPDVYENEFRLKTKGGDYRWMRAEARVVERDEKGDAVYMIGSHQDITERKQAEEAIAEERALFKAIIDHIPVMITHYDPSARMLYLNEKFERTLGWKTEEVQNIDIMEEVYPDPDYRRQAMAYMEEARAGWKEFRLQSKSGEIIHSEWSNIRLEDGTQIGIGIDITDRKKAETEIYKVKTLLDATGRMARVGGWELDAETLEVTWTEETYRIHEVPVGHKPSLQEAIDFFHSEDREKLSEAIQRALDYGEPYDMEIRFITAGGKHLWTRTICRPQTRDGKVEKLIGTFQDITDRKQAEDALYEESVFRKTVIAESPVGIGIYDAETGKCVATNSAIVEIIGGTEDQVLAQNFYEIDSWKRSGLLERAKSALEGHENIHHTVELTTSFGKEVVLDCYFAPFTIGEKRYLMVTATDISELLKTQKALKSSHETFLTVLDSIDATIYVADMETHEILFMNKHMRDCFGKDFTGRICWEVFRGESGPCPHCTNDKLLDKDGKPAGVCVWNDRNPITGKWYINYDRAIEWTDGHMVRLQIATDITELKKMEAELRQAYKMEAIGTLAGGIAHDFNNVLGIILGNIEMASADIPEDDRANSNLHEALRACFRARDMVRQILAFSRRQEVAYQPVDIRPVVKEALKMLRSSIPTTIEIQQDISIEKAMVMGDPTGIHQVLMNLCTNAVDAMDEMGSVLQVGLSRIDLDVDAVRGMPGLEAGSHIRLTVSDTGHGISPDVLDRVFDPYFTTKEVGRGTGMGLAVLHGIVKEHGGAVSVYSEEGKGTTFHVFFPEIEHGADKYRPPVEPIPGGAESVLYVDDEEALASLGQRMLESLGYTVDVRTSSIDALGAFRADTGKYDLVITDMTMPNMTGDILAKEVMGLRPDIPVILTTGFSHRMDEEKARSIGIKAFVTKPLVKSDLASTVRKVLDEK